MADGLRAIVVDAPVIGSALNEWPHGPAAALLRACIARDRCCVVLSNRLKDALHAFYDSGGVNLDLDSFRGFVGLLEIQAQHHPDDEAVALLAWPDYMNAVATAEAAAAVVTYDADVAQRITAAPVFQPEDRPELLCR